MPLHCLICELETICWQQYVGHNMWGTIFGPQYVGNNMWATIGNSQAHRLTDS